VLVPVDFSPRSADSLGIATSICEAAGLDECLALHVYFNDAAVTFDEFDEILVENAERAFGIFTAPVDLHGVFARPSFVEAPNVAQTILRVAVEQTSDLIVMGTRGRSASAAVLLGSETEQTLMRAALPVLAVKHFGARMRLFQALRDQRVQRRDSQERYT
jgi:nucleotide-binding universal stress UspA family protein